MLMNMVIILIKAMNDFRIRHPKIWCSLIHSISITCSIELMLSLLCYGTNLGCILLVDAFSGIMFVESIMKNIASYANNIQKLQDEGSL